MEDIAFGRKLGEVNESPTLNNAKGNKLYRNVNRMIVPEHGPKIKVNIVNCIKRIHVFW